MQQLNLIQELSQNGIRGDSEVDFDSLVKEVIELKGELRRDENTKETFLCSVLLVYN